LLPAMDLNTVGATGLPTAGRCARISLSACQKQGMGFEPTTSSLGNLPGHTRRKAKRFLADSDLCPSYPCGKPWQTIPFRRKESQYGTCKTVQEQYKPQADGRIPTANYSHPFAFTRRRRTRGVGRFTQQVNSHLFAFERPARSVFDLSCLLPSRTEVLRYERFNHEFHQLADLSCTDAFRRRRETPGPCAGKTA